MNKHVTSLELSKKLKAAGIKQESEFYWAPGIKRPLSGLALKDEAKDIYHSAFLASELLEILPDRVKDKQLSMWKAEKLGWGIGYGNITYYVYVLNSEYFPEAAGEMVLWCKENKYL